MVNPGSGKFRRALAFGRQLVSFRNKSKTFTVIRVRVMGAFLDKPKTEKSNEHGHGIDLKFAISTMQGWRVEMEDAHCAKIGISPELSQWSFFAVFDGHAGHKVARYCADALLQFILETDEFKELSSLVAGSPDADLEKVNELVRRGIRNGFLQVDAHMRTIDDLCSDNERSGSTAVCVLISPTYLYFANLGDSRAVMSRDCCVFFTTEDHKPYNAKERERITNAGGSVMIQRVNGSLAVSRALGDYEYKSYSLFGPCEQMVSPEPDITAIERDLSKDEFIILACDGIFDVMNNNELVDFVRSRLRVTECMESIVNQVVDSCLSKGSRDNMSVVLITLPGSPKVSKAAVDAEMELRDQLEARIRGIASFCDSADDYDTEYVLRVLSNQDIAGLPPGAGVHALRDAVDEIVDKLKKEALTPTQGHLDSVAPNVPPTNAPTISSPDHSLTTTSSPDGGSQS